MPIVIGIDAHKNTHTAVAVEEGTGRQLAEITVKARTKGHESLVRWARSIDPERRFAVEDCRHVSGGLERHLIARGERVVRVGTRLMAGARRQGRTRGKSDPIDALAVARAALREADLPEAHLAGPERDLRLLVDRRETLVRRRSEDQSRLRWLLHDLDPDLDIPARSLGRAIVQRRVTASVAAIPPTMATELCLELLAGIGEVTRTVNEMERRITAMVKDLAPTLLEMAGCGALTAAKIVGEVAGVARFGSEAKLAMHTGVAPLPVWSGDRTRFRLNRSGNRQLNAAMHRIAVTQMRMHDPARTFMARKISEGKSKTEALRSLKRHIVRKVFNVLTEDDKIRSTAGSVPAAA